MSHFKTHIATSQVCFLVSKQVWFYISINAYFYKLQPIFFLSIYFKKNYNVLIIIFTLTKYT